ncbi:hypothetical protein L6452_28170 [Arctium lappa]|uniref:Uncharacterized protein n=1 Tax=Arctium lappa TaxID=4217 RepID=A0ACB8ZXY7_ARCLA|nr:hypothetical protein L6452_28170 [Arctium lappa]
MMFMPRVKASPYLTVDENFGPSSASDSDSDSNSNSSLVVENSKGRLQQIEDSAKDCVTTWTDEKHDLYLDHLESSFVEQLHRSIGILSWCSEHDSRGPYFSQKLHAKTRNTSQQLKMIQDDCSEKIDLKRSRPLLNRAVDSLVLLKSRPRCVGKQRFARAAKRQDSSAARNLCTEDKLLFNEAGIRSEQIAARHEKLVDCSGGDYGHNTREFSDQNFADEASEQICGSHLNETVLYENDIVEDEWNRHMISSDCWVIQVFAQSNRISSLHSPTPQPSLTNYGPPSTNCSLLISATSTFIFTTIHHHHRRPPPHPPQSPLPPSPPLSHPTSGHHNLSNHHLVATISTTVAAFANS